MCILIPACLMLRISLWCSLAMRLWASSSVSLGVGARLCKLGQLHRPYVLGCWKDERCDIWEAVGAMQGMCGALDRICRCCCLESSCSHDPWLAKQPLSPICFSRSHHHAALTYWPAPQAGGGFKRTVLGCGSSGV